MKRLCLWVALLLSSLAFAQGQMPVTPGAISLFYENDEYVFRTQSGLTLYTFDKDLPLQSVCVEECAKKWPPFSANNQASVVGDWKPVSRSDGKRQWTYKGAPIYTFINDTPGNIRGDGLGGVWHQVKP